MKRQQDYDHTDSLFTAEQMTGSGQYDMLAQIAHATKQTHKEKLKGKPVRRFLIQATCITPHGDLDGDDQFELDLIIAPFKCDALNEDDALDYYHGIIPIACLDDFEITCKEVGK